MTRAYLALITSIVLATGAVVLCAADWPQFRGPGGSGIAMDRGLPVTWSADNNVAWKVALPGPGASAPSWSATVFS
jgi:outer membrane protein assembly factor BamB